MLGFISKTISLTQQGHKSLTAHKKVSVNGYFSSAKRQQLTANSKITFSTLYYNYSIADCLSHL